MKFEGKSVIVTGAGKGIGRVLTEKLHSLGAQVIAITRSQEDIDDLQKEFNCKAIQVDLSCPDATRKAILAALPADYLVNCAGTTDLQSFLDLTVESFDHLFAVNTRAPMIIAQEYARSVIKSGQSGAIVNVSSMATFSAFPDHTAYSVSKGGLDELTKLMALELAPKGIRVNSVNPIVTLTAMAEKAWSDPEKSKGMLSRIPLGRFANPIDVAEVIIYLLSDESKMLNGVIMPVDGGFNVT